MASKCKIKDPVEFKQKIEQYFLQCDNDNEPYTMTGLALAIGTSRMALLRYKKEENISLPLEVREEISELVDYAKTKCEYYAQKQLFRNGNTTGIIFNLKNNHEGWIEKSEVVGVNAEEKKELNLTGLSKEDLKELIYQEEIDRQE